MAPPGGARGERKGRKGGQRIGRKGKQREDRKLVIATAIGVQAVQAKHRSFLPALSHTCYGVDFIHRAAQPPARVPPAHKQKPPH